MGEIGKHILRAVHCDTVWLKNPITGVTPHHSLTRWQPCNTWQIHSDYGHVSDACTWWMQPILEA